MRFFRSDDPRRKSRVHLTLFGREYALQPLIESRTSEERARFFVDQKLGTGLVDRPWLWWNEVTADLHSIEDGQVVAEYVTASLNGTTRSIARHLSSSAEVDTM